MIAAESLLLFSFLLVIASVMGFVVTLANAVGSWLDG
jgi:hypothetical protein